jgi:hypothetical protein
LIPKPGLSGSIEIVGIELSAKADPRMKSIPFGRQIDFNEHMRKHSLLTVVNSDSRPMSATQLPVGRSTIPQGLELNAECGSIPVEICKATTPTIRDL